MTAPPSDPPASAAPPQAGGVPAGSGSRNARRGASAGGNSGIDGEFARRLTEARTHHGAAVPVDRIGTVVKSVLGTLSGDLSAADVALYHELEDLARYIQTAKAEIVALNPTDIREEFLPTAADELDAIVQSTEQATGEIMDASEIIETVAAELADLPGGGEGAERLTEATTRIYEACSFQDLTGQRITKVVRMLKSIETRVDRLIQAFEPGDLGQPPPVSTASPPAAGDASSVQQAQNFGRAATAATGDRPDDASLLNGPAAAEDAMKQDDIDALLASFD